MSYLKNLGAIRIAILFLILANIIWGAGFPIYKWALGELPPFTFAFLRFFIGAIILLPFVFKDYKVARQDWRNTILLGIFGITLLIPFLFLGLQLTPSINAPVIIAVGPIILIGASILFLKEKLRLKVLGGTLISLLGIIVILIHPLLIEGFSGGFIGNMLIFLATFCSVIQAVLLKKLTVRNNPLTLTFWMFLIGSLPLIPFVIWETQTFNIITDITIKGFIGLVYGIFFAAILAHFFLAYGVAHIKASEVGVFTYVDPIATVAVAVPLLGESITYPYLVGAMLVFLGIFIAEGRLHYHPFHKLFTKS
jgi:drug/metabolite transporter (DMT)-like permease